MDWLNVLDFQRSLTNCHNDILGDWYRDPWGWAELDWTVAKRSDLLATRLNGSGVRRTSKIDVPKENFITRPAMVIDPLDRLCYQSLVDASSVPIIGDLRPWVFGWRLRRRSPARGSYSSNSREWDAYRARLRQLAHAYSYGLQTDIVSFFASIPIERLCDDIADRARNEVTRRLADMLVGWSRVPGRPGLPQRFMASSALANFYLRPLDDTIDALADGRRSKLPVPASVRWMDDIWVFADDPGELRRAQLRLESGMRDLGLHMGAGKTKLLAGSELLEAAHEIEHGYIDAALNTKPPDHQPLEELVVRLIAAPEDAPRTSIRFACTRIRSAERWDLATRFAEVANRMPQGADHLARVFRLSGIWRKLGDWYVAYCSSPWGAVEWGPAQFGTMFPAGDQAPEKVAELFERLVPQRPSLPLTAVAAHRLASWHPDTAREVIRESAKRSTDPLERRVLALAALMAGEERHVVGALLREYEENEGLLLMLQDRRFRKLSVSADYSG